MINLRLIHYGSDRYEPEKFDPICDVRRNKPRGGLWTSPVGSRYGWADWCKSEEFDTDLESSFIVNFSGSILIINQASDLDRLQWDNFDIPSFKNLTADYDAIFLTYAGEKATRYTEPKSLYGWDCETVLVMNQNSLSVPLESGSSQYEN